MGVVRVKGLGKFYKHYSKPGHRLLEWAGFGLVRQHDPVWVLRGVSFELAPGEAVGVVGANGAGKSTLLKLINGTLSPSEGSVVSEGRVAALEIGLGFHPDFSGRENLLTAGALIGLDAERVEALLPEIEDFAEIGPVLDDPVRTYSTGMQLRLAFSLATAVRPDVLLIDEALAVGDVYFQQKCMARIRHFREQGSTLVLVSHDATAIKTLCDRALLIEDGLLVRQGSPVAVLEYYNALMAKRTADYEIKQGGGLVKQGGTTRSGDRGAVIERVELRGADGPAGSFQVGSNMQIRLEGRANRRLEGLTVGISIRDRLGNEIFGTNTHHLRGSSSSSTPPLPSSPALDAGDRFRAVFLLPVNLGCGSYGVTAALHAGPVHLEGSYDWWDNICVFQVFPGPEAPFVGSTYLPAEARIERIGPASRSGG